MQPPFFVVGAPRSGTTYLVEVLRHHPSIFLTNETRVFTFLSRSLYSLGAERFVLLNERRAFLETYRRHMREIVEDFYKALGADEDHVWGDKFPHYADPKSDPRCLDLINATFPQSRLIHLIRDGRDVVASLVAKGWADTQEAADVWLRHVRHARQFGTRIGLDRYLEIRYEDLVTDGIEAVRRIEAFLGVPHDHDVQAFVTEQMQERTPFSKPMSDPALLGDVGTWRSRLTVEQAEQVDGLLAVGLAEFGYRAEAASIATACP